MTARLRPWSATPYDDIAAAFSVRHVMTHIENALCVATNESVTTATEQLASDGFDYAPVTEAGQVVGVFQVDGGDSEPGRCVVDVLQRLTPDNTVDADAPLEDLPGWLCECQFQIVFSRKRVVGLVNAADLNKQPMRSLLFLHIADAERKLAELIRREYPWNDDWFGMLSDKRRERIAETREEIEKGDVDIDLLEFAYFTDLVTVISKSTINDRVKPLLNWSLAKHGGGIGELRNSACHPVRPVLRTVAELPGVVERFGRLRDLIHAADKLLG